MNETWLGIYETTLGYLPIDESVVTQRMETERTRGQARVCRHGRSAINPIAFHGARRSFAPIGTL